MSVTMPQLDAKQKTAFAVAVIESLDTVSSSTLRRISEIACVCGRLSGRNAAETGDVIRPIVEWISNVDDGLPPTEAVRSLKSHLNHDGS